MKNDPYVLAAFLQAKEQDNWVADGTNSLVTLSRQFGAEGEEMAFRATEILTGMSHGKQPWIVVDQDMGERVIADHHLPTRISRFFSGEEVLSIEEHIEGIFGISVPGATRIENLTRTIVQLARIGHVILVGRAAHLITAKFPRAVHVRVIGSFERRVERIAASRHCTWDEAAAEVRKVDQQRRRFIATYFHSNLEDLSPFDMILNTDRVSVEEGAHMIAQLVSRPDFRKQEAQKLHDLRERVLG